MRLLALCAVLVAFAGACDDVSNAPQDLSTAVPHNFEQINTLILQPLCANFSVCHSKTGERDAGHLNLDVADPYSTLVNVLSDNDVAMAEGKLRVEPCNPDDSFLWIKLNLPLTNKNADLKGTYGSSMPRDNPHLPAEQLAAIRDWIARGAHKDEPADVTGATCEVDDAAVSDLAMAD